MLVRVAAMPTWSDGSKRCCTSTEATSAATARLTGRSLNLAWWSGGGDRRQHRDGAPRLIEVPGRRLVVEAADSRHDRLRGDVS